MWIVILQELCGQDIDDWSNFTKLVVSWITSREQSGVVNKMEITHDLKEAIPHYPVSYWYIESGLFAQQLDQQVLG